jgi:hypothetical protein
MKLLASVIRATLWCIPGLSALLDRSPGAVATAQAGVPL